MSQSAQSDTRVIEVNALARVEGEGALYLRVHDGAIADLKFRIYEPPRFFEALLEGRDFRDAPDITARICGICPMAYILSACQAMEAAAGVSVTGPLRDLRRLAYCGEWIQSHVLHVFLLHAPDFLGYDDSIQLSRDHPEVVKKALKLKKLGNQVLEVIGGRAVQCTRSTSVSVACTACRAARPSRGSQTTSNGAWRRRSNSPASPPAWPSRVSMMTT